MTNGSKEYAEQAQSLSKTENNYNLGVLELSYKQTEKIFEDPEGAVNFISKYYTVPTDQFYINASNLPKMPPEEVARLIYVPHFKIGSQTGPKTENLKPEESEKRLQLVTAAAKLKVAMENLDLSKKKKEEYNGKIENFLGAVAGVQKLITRREFFKWGKRLGYAFAVMQLANACNQVLPPTTQVAETAPLPTQIPTEKPTVIPTEKPTQESFKMNPELPPHIAVKDIYANYSIVTLEDLLSGKLLEQQLDYIQKNQIFSDKVISTNQLLLQSSLAKSSYWNKSYQEYFINFPKSKNYSTDSETRPFKVISYYIFQDIALFTNLIGGRISDLPTTEQEGWGKKHSFPYWIISWAYYNPSGKVSVVNGLLQLGTLRRINENSLIPKKIPFEDFKILPTYKYNDYKTNPLASEEEKRSQPFLLNKLFEKYPALIPDEKMVKKWAEKGEMPDELQKKIFARNYSLITTWTLY